MLIGHEDKKTRLGLAIKSADLRNNSLPHILLTGTPGCGKTTTAKWISTLGNYDYLEASPLGLNNKQRVLQLFNQLNTTGYNQIGDRVGKIRPTIIFFDEIHQMPVIGQEFLGLAMEYFELDASTQNKKIWLPYFTIVGATTNEGLLTKPFRERFRISFLYEPYDLRNLYNIMLYHSNNFKLLIEQEAGKDIVTKCRGIPRILINYLTNIRDYIYSNKKINSDGMYIVTLEDTKIVFSMLDIDKFGLTRTEIKILQYLYKIQDPVGVDNLAISTGESAKTIQSNIEPFLIKSGFLIRSTKGRKLTNMGRQYLEDEGYVEEASSKQLISSNYQRQ